MDAPKKNKSKSEPSATVQNFPIVGIGASAGGLDAFRRLLAAIPEISGMAYVLVQHLDPSHESILPEILQRVTKIPVHEITDDIHLAPDHIYIIPSNKILTSTDGVLQLTPRDKKIVNLSIDVFFTSLAHVHKEFAVGVVLSGTGSDGTIGLKAIKEYGGISIAQDNESATYDSMPQSAVNAGIVDFILAPEKIPQQLLQINSAYKTSHFFKEEEELPKDDEAIFKQILLVLRQRSGVDFTYYKQPTFHRRIARRIAIVKKKNLTDYLKFLRADKAEQDALFQDVLIPVTSFFRDPKTFQILTEKVFPILFKNKNAIEPIRVWIAGCSTGEEAFSIAICLHEFLGEKLPDTRIQIFASDISEKAIKKARAAIYTKADVEILSANQLKNYFVKNNGGYEVNKLIRDMCVFAPHNFLKDPPFAKMDLITCRNVLIYMDTFLQKKAFTTFHYALKENGFLLLGKSETTGASSDLFTQVSKNEKIYSRKPVQGRFMPVATERREEALSTEDKTETKCKAVHSDFRKSAEAIIISKSPASVVVNEQMDIVHIYGHTSPFLQSPQGKPTHNLLKMAREELAFELRNAIHKATKEQATITKENIPVALQPTKGGISNPIQLVTIEVIPLTDTTEPHFLIRFTQATPPSMRRKGDENNPTSGGWGTAIQQFEEELSQTREDMRSITEDMEAGNEELQSANEELQSSNEEMQSLNEELETSKEELQSTNEELIILNQELIDKQEQLNVSHFYSEAIVTTMREPLVILDQALRIKTANTSFYKKFNIEKKETENKLFYEIQNHQFDDTLLRSLLEKILPQKNRIEDFEINLRLPNKGDRTILLNALQIINKKEAEQLILLAMEDITDRVRSEKILIESEARSKKERKLLHDFFTQATALLAIIKGSEYVFEFANPAYRELIGNRDPTGKTMLEANPETKRQGLIELLDNVYNTGETFTGKEMPVMVNRGNGKLEQLYLNFTYQAFTNDIGETEGILIFAYDVSEQVEARKQIEESEKRFRTLSETVPHMIWTATPEGKKNSFNKYFINYTGLSFEELIDDGWQKTIFPEDLERELREWHHALKTGEDFKIEKRVRHHNGTYRWHISHGIAQKNNGGTIIGWIGSNTEIEDQKQITEALAKGEEQFRTFANNIQNLAWIANGEGWIYWYNQRWYDYTGTTLEEMEGWGWQKVHHPDHVEKIIELTKELWKKNEPFELTFPLRRHDGEYRWFLTRAYPVKDANGNIERWVGTNTDITKQKYFTEELERRVKERTQELQIQNQRFEIAENIAKLGSYSWNMTTGALEYSDNLFRLFDCEPKEFVPSIEKFLTFIHPDDLQQVTNNGKETMQTGVLVETPYRIISKTGTIKYFRSSGKFSGEGNNRMLIGTVQDISKDVAASKQLKTKNIELENANTELASFSYVASHDLQEPLRKIQGFSKRIIDKDGEKLSDTTKDYFNRIIGAAQRMQNLIESLLSFSRTNLSEVIFEKTDLNQTLIEVQAVMKDLIKKKNAVIESQNLPALNAVPVQMHQLFLNLIGNSLKYSKPNVAPHIKITAEKVTINKMAGLVKQNGTFWKITISDNGIGFEHQYENKIFELFQRLHGKTEYEGTGIGLAICKKIVQIHNGTITATGQPGIGSTFTFFLSDNSKS